MRIRGTSGNNWLLGSSGRSEIFDTDVGGRDTLLGRGGDDVYWLGRRTGHDIIDEAYMNEAMAILATRSREVGYWCC